VFSLYYQNGRFCLRIVCLLLFYQFNNWIRKFILVLSFFLCKLNFFKKKCLFRIYKLAVIACKFVCNIFFKWILRKKLLLSIKEKALNFNLYFKQRFLRRNNVNYSTVYMSGNEWCSIISQTSYWSFFLCKLNFFKKKCLFPIYKLAVIACKFVCNIFF